MKNLLKKAIEWAFFKYVVGDLEQIVMDDEEYEETIEFELEPELQEALDALSYSLKGVSVMELVDPKFDNEVQQAMYEKRFHTIH